MKKPITSRRLLKQNFVGVGPVSLLGIGTGFARNEPAMDLETNAGQQTSNGECDDPALNAPACLRHLHM